MKKFKALFILIPFFIVNLLTEKTYSATLAEIAELEKIKCSPEYEYLEPFHGVSLATQPLLPNLYKYLDPQSQTKSSSKDPIQTLIKTLFNIPPSSHDPIFFNPNPLAKNFSKFLSPSTLGKILASLLKYSNLYSKNTPLSDISKLKADLKAELKTKISSDPDHDLLIRQGREVARKYNTFYEDLKTQRNTLTTELNTKKNLENCLPKDLENLEKQIENINLELKKSSALVEQFQPESWHLNDFISLLISAWESAVSVKNSDRYIFLNQLLIALGWKNSKNKEDFGKLYQALIPDCTLPPDSLHNEVQYSHKDFAIWKKKLNEMAPEEQANFFIQNPWIALLLSPYSANFFNPIEPHQIGYERTQYQGFVFPDCMETSIFNFLSIIAKSIDSTFDPKLLEIPGFKMDPRLTPFFQEFNTPSKINSPKAHEKIAEILSGRPNLTYGNSQAGCNLKSSLDNIFKALVALLLNPNPEAAPEPKQLDLITHGSRADLLNFLVKYFHHSNPPFSLEWDFNPPKIPFADPNYQKERDHKLNSLGASNVELAFLINAEHKFTWKILPGHSEINVIKPSIDLDNLVEILAQKAKQTNSPFRKETHILSLMTESRQIEANPILQDLYFSLSEHHNLPFRYYTSLNQPFDRIKLAANIFEVNKNNPIEKYKNSIIALLSSVDPSFENNMQILLTILKHNDYKDDQSNIFDQKINEIIKDLNKLPIDNDHFITLLSNPEIHSNLLLFSKLLEILKKNKIKLGAGPLENVKVFRILLDLIELSKQNQVSSKKMIDLLLDRVHPDALELPSGAFYHDSLATFAILENKFDIAELFIRKCLDSYKETPENETHLRKKLLNRIITKAFDSGNDKFIELVLFDIFHPTEIFTPEIFQTMLKQIKSSIIINFIQHAIRTINNETLKGWIQLDNNSTGENIFHLIISNKHLSDDERIDLIKALINGKWIDNDFILEKFNSINTTHFLTPIASAILNGNNELVIWFIQLIQSLTPLNQDLTKVLDKYKIIDTSLTYVNNAILDRLENKNLLPSISNQEFISRAEHGRFMTTARPNVKEEYNHFLSILTKHTSIEDPFNTHPNQQTVLQYLLMHEARADIIINWLNKFNSPEPIINQLNASVNINVGMNSRLNFGKNLGHSEKQTKYLDLFLKRDDLLKSMPTNNALFADFNKFLETRKRTTNN